MAVKVVASFAKKIPADCEFSSQSFHLSIESEVSSDLAPTEMRRRIHEQFVLVRTAVEEELRDTRGSERGPLPPPEDNVLDRPTGQRKLSGKATNKQIVFMTDLWVKRLGREIHELNAMVQEQHGINGLYGLSKQQAADIITRLKKTNKRAA